MGDDAYDQRASDLDEDLLEDEIEVGSLGVRGAGASGLFEDEEPDEADLDVENFSEDLGRDFLDEDDEEEVEEDEEDEQEL